MDENKVDFEKMTPAERLKYEVAEEIGLADKVRQYGWRSLTAKESGRIGGKHQKPLKIKEKSNIFKGFQICRLRDLNPHGVATNGF